MEIHHFYICQQRPIRFLSLVNRETVSFIESIENDRYRGIPLFLGKDVLDGISIQGKNHARIHGRFAKDGLTVKLNLNDFGIDGISNCKSVYFYNIKGLFQAVFEYHDFEVQRGCLLKLRDLWLRHHGDSALPESLHIKSVSPLPHLFSNNPVRIVNLVEHHKKKCQIPTEDKSVSPSENKTSVVTGIKKCTDGLQHSNSESVLESSFKEFGKDASKNDHNQTSTNPDNSISFHPEINKRVVTETDETKDDYREVLTSKSHICSKCSSQKVVNSEQSSPLKIETVLEHLEIMLHDIKLQQEIEKTRSLSMTRLANAFVLLQFIKCEIYGEHFNPQNSFPVQLLEKYLVTVSENSSEGLSNTFGIPCRRDAALCIISEWLGKQFHRMEAQISVKVDQFKKDHIACIDNLPPSENIIELLFPVCMKQLVSNWIGQRLDRGCAPVSDHDYGPPEKRARENEQEASLYPVIQLLLEFANNALVSGVAHVVYSRLRHSL